MEIEEPLNSANTPALPGVTPSERYLGQLARRSFLTLWSYTNLFTNEGQKNGGDGKELCDLLIVFDNYILLFSDKHCNYPEHQDIKIAWSRWYKRAVQKSVNQLLGAESWLRRFPDRVFLDSHCTRPFPLPIPDIKNACFHRIAVTRGAYTKCREFFGGRSTGSLMIDTCVYGADHFSKPFTIGHVAPQKGYIHVLDELTLNVVLREMDTITDFISYLQKKEALLTKPECTVLATGEEQLVAMYQTGLNKNSEHDFPEIPDHIKGLFIDEGQWEEFIRNPQYLAKKEADRVSYVWDNLIEHFIKGSNRATGTNMRDNELALRVMASEPRMRRRQLATQLLDVLRQKVEPGKRLTRLGISDYFPDNAYVFLILPCPDFVKSYEEYREGRKAMLLACCKVAKLRAPKAKRIVGMATEPGGTKGASEDLLLLETNGDGWTVEHAKEAKELQEKLCILKNESTTYYETRDKEYPNVDPTPTPPIAPGLIKPDQYLNRAQRRTLDKKRRNTLVKS